MGRGGKVHAYTDVRGRCLTVHVQHTTHIHIHTCESLGMMVVVHNPSQSSARRMGFNDSRREVAGSGWRTSHLLVSAELCEDVCVCACIVMGSIMRGCVLHRQEE